MKIENLKPLIKVVISKPNSENSSKEYDALIDTGATKTFISDKIVTELNLDKGGSGIMSGATGGEIKVDLYILYLLIESHTKSVKLECGVFGGRKECDVIIGMDIITHGELNIKGHEFTFNIQMLK